MSSARMRNIVVLGSADKTNATQVICVVWTKQLLISPCSSGALRETRQCMDTLGDS